eukprot:1613221-Pleurochrysis_carterae.AAC.1
MEAEGRGGDEQVPGAQNECVAVKRRSQIRQKWPIQTGKEPVPHAVGGGAEQVAEVLRSTASAATLSMKGLRGKTASPPLIV